MGFKTVDVSHNRSLRRIDKSRYLYKLAKKHNTAIIVPNKSYGSLYNKWNKNNEVKIISIQNKNSFRGIRINKYIVEEGVNEKGLKFLYQYIGEDKLIMRYI